MKKIRKLMAVLMSLSMIFPMTQVRAETAQNILPYQDTTRTFEERAADLVTRMTLQEKVAQLGNVAPAVSRLGVHDYNYWREALHGVARQGQATSFPISLAMSNTWNRDLIFSAADVTSTEARGKNAKYNLSYWSPTVNMARDPRWGRNDETYGEDPYLTGQLGIQFVNGMQGDDSKYLKTIATLKHFLANNSETEREKGSSVMDERTLRENYGKVFQNIVEKAHPASIMSSYNTTTVTRNGSTLYDYIASPANPYTLTDLLRRDWGFSGYVTGDCGAVGDLNSIAAYKQALFPGQDISKIPQSATIAKSIKAGNNMDCGSASQSNGYAAVKDGYMSIDDLDRAVYEMFLQRMRTGEFDMNAKYSDIKSDVIETNEHIRFAEKAAEESWVLLKNKDDILPLAASAKNIALVGPLANKMVLGDYSGTPVRTTTPYAGLINELAKINPDAKVNYLNDFSIDKYKQQLDAADVIIAYAGTELSDSSESNDRSSIKLPASQSHVDAVTKAYPQKTIVAMQTVGQIDVSPFIDNAKAVLWTSYNGQTQGEALGKIITGQANPSGRLTTTWYAPDDLKIMPLNTTGVKGSDGITRYYNNYSIRSSAGFPGRTYQYYKGNAVFPFGYGLSYTQFTYSDIQISSSNVDVNDKLTITAHVANTGNKDGSEVVQLYVSALGADGVQYPLKQLKGFEKLELKAGETRVVSFDLDLKDMKFFDESSQKTYVPLGKYSVMIGKNANDVEALKADFSVTGDLKVALKTVKAIPTGLRVYSAFIGGKLVPKIEVNAQLSAVMTNEQVFDLNRAKVTYSSADERIATVDATGKVSGGRQSGVTTITASVTIDGVTKMDSFPIVNGLQGSSGMSAYSDIEAEYANEMSGVDIATPTLSYITSVQNLGYLKFDNIDFKDVYSNTFVANVASNVNGSRIDIVLDNIDGSVIGSCLIPNTGSDQAWYEVACPITKTTGQHNVILKFNGSAGTNLMNIDKIKFLQDGRLDRTGWTATALSYPDLANNVLDGSRDSNWHTGVQKVGDYLLIDMKSNKTFDRITLDNKAGDNPRGYDVFVSTDGTNFGSKIASGEGDPDTDTTTITFNAQTGRYIKILLTKNDASYWWTCYELNVWNSNAQDTIPAAPSKLSAAADDKQVKLTWNTAVAGMYYNVKRSTTPGGPYTVLVNNLAGNSYTDITAVKDTNYYYIVTAGNTAGEGAASNEVSVTVLSHRNPFYQIEAETFDSKSGSATIENNTPDGGKNVGYIKNGDYLAYNNYDFNNVASKFIASVSADNNAGGTIEVRIDSPTGTLIGSLNVSNTGGWTNYKSLSTPITTSVTGVHNVYLVMKSSNNYICNIDWFKFEVVSVAITKIMAPTDISGLPNGTAKTALALGLPEQVVIVTNSGNMNADVTWNVGASSYDPALRTAQTFTVNGTIILPAGVVNPNNIALTTSISVTVLPAPTIPQSTLKGLQQVNTGQTFDVTMGLTDVTQSVYQQMYAQDLMLHYDPANLQFDSVTSLKDGFRIIDQKEVVPGHIRIVAASVGANQGVLTQGDLLKFKFTAKSVTQATSTTISVGNVIIANGEGNELQVGGASREIQISIPSVPVDKSLLNASIASAQAKYNAAVEGNGDGLYAMGSKAQLQLAIDTASRTANDSNATQQQVDSAKAALDAAMQVFDTKLITADVNGDGSISIGDLAIVAGAYGKQQGQEGWIEKADVNHDGKVDIEDLAIGAKAILK